ncbi:MAG: gliding motility lipoprotein GldH [Bacteroidales bacterium]
MTAVPGPGERIIKRASEDKAFLVFLPVLVCFVVIFRYLCVMKRPLCLLPLFLLLLSCERNTIFEQHVNMDNHSWSKFSAVDFHFDIDDTSASYDVFIAIRHSAQYPGHNLLISTVLITPSGEKRFTEYDLRIRDDEDKFPGDGPENLRDIQIPLRKDFTFKEAGTCDLEIENRMPKLQTPGIHKIGLVVQKK